MNRRVITYTVKNRYGESHKAEVKGPGERVVIGTFPSVAEAVAAGREYMATGVKPPPKKRGRKPKPASERKPRARPKPRPKPERPVAAQPCARAGRLEMIRRLAQSFA